MGGKVDRIPATSLAGCGGTVNVEMQEATGIYWPEAHKDPEKMAKLAIASYELSGLEGIRIPFDFVEEPEALGCKIKWSERKDFVPAVQEPAYSRPEDLKMPEKPLELGRIPVILQAIKLIREKVGDFLPISSLVLGPFTLAAMLAGEAKFLTWVLRKPDYVRAFVDFATEFLIEYGRAQYRAGSDIVQVGDPTASPDLISPDQFRNFAKPSLIRMADELKRYKTIAHLWKG
jgi:[methyl-Co(III) methanol-specific corrinoid protein]:coenzyme M methyltransferase